MVTKELLDYIRTETDRGVPRDTIHAMLVQSGWDAQDISEAETVIEVTPHPKTAPVAPIVQQEIIPEIKLEKMPDNKLEVSPKILPITVAQPEIVPEIKSEPVKPNVETSSLLAALESFKQAPSHVTMPSTGTPTSTPVVVTPVMAVKDTAPITIQPAETQAATTQSTATITENPRPKKSFLRKLLIPVIILLALVSGGAAYGYYAGYFISMSAIGNDAYHSIRTASGGSFDTTITVDLSGIKQENATLSMLPGFSSKMSLTANGAYDRTDPNNTKLHSNLSLKAGTFSMAAEIRLISQILYFKTTDVPVIPLFDLANYKDQWLSTPTQKQQGDTSPVPFLGNGIVDSITLSALTDEQRAHIADMAANVHFISTIKKETPENMNGVLSYHFTFGLDRDNISKFLFDLEQYIHEVGKEDSVLSSFSTASANENLSKIKSFNGEAWIGKTDHMPYKIVLDFTSQEGNDVADTAKINVTAIFKDWNKPITVEVPEGSVPFKSFIDKTVQKAQDKSRDEMIRAAINDSHAIASDYFTAHTKSYAGLCLQINPIPTEGTAVSPTTPVPDPAITAPLPVPETKENKIAISCKDTTASFIMYAPLVEVPGTFACTDSKTSPKELDHEPKGLICK